MSACAKCMSTLAQTPCHRSSQPSEGAQAHHPSHSPLRTGNSEPKQQLECCKASAQNKTAPQLNLFCTG
eukprot:3979027-Pleurochrysis_carterae.AAC.4